MPRRRGPFLVLAVGLLGLVVAVAIAIGQVGDSGGSGAEPQPAASGTVDATGGSGPTASVSPSAATSPTATAQQPTGRPQSAALAAAANACAQEIATTEAVVVAARVAAGHWREHVQARTDLLAGKNSEATTKAIWKRTRLAGPADIARLGAATNGQARADGGCAKFTGQASVACRQRLAAVDAASAAGRAASGDWASHLAKMAAHAAGDFGSEHAQNLWIAAWASAPRNLNAFAQAEVALAKAPGCRPS
ncbi:MAG TPA: hypothetical protein VFT31_05140 [Kribbella sp.]|nr:hypothetical protein [Kribbella sp.]